MDSFKIRNICLDYYTINYRMSDLIILLIYYPRLLLG